MIVQNFKYSREELDLKQKDIIEIFGVHFTTVSGWETGKYTIPIERLVDYANCFHYSLDYFPLTLDLDVIAKNLRNIRKRNNLTQDQLTKKVNTTQASYSHYENVTDMIPTVFLYNLTKIYKPFSMDGLLGRKKQ